MILECWFYMFRGIYRHLIKAQEQIYSRFVQNVKLAKPTFSTRRGDSRTTTWACATCLIFENLLPVAPYSRRVSDLKVPNKTTDINWTGVNYLFSSTRFRNQKRGWLADIKTKLLYFIIIYYLFTPAHTFYHIDFIRNADIKPQFILSHLRLNRKHVADRTIIRWKIAN